MIYNPVFWVNLIIHHALLDNFLRRNFFVFSFCKYIISFKTRRCKLINCNFFVNWQFLLFWFKYLGNIFQKLCELAHFWGIERLNNKYFWKYQNRYYAVWKWYLKNNPTEIIDTIIYNVENLFKVNNKSTRLT